MTVEKELERKVINTKGTGMKWEKEFFLRLQEAIVDGWRIADNNKRADASMRNFKGNSGRAVLYRELEDTLTFVKEKEAPVPAEEVEVKEAPKKKDKPKSSKKTTTKK